MKTMKIIKEGVCVDENGHTYTYHRHPLDFMGKGKKDEEFFVAKNLLSLSDVDELRRLYKDKDAEHFNESVHLFVAEYNDLTGFFNTYTDRIKKIHKRIVKKEQTILSLLKDMSFEKDPRGALIKIKKHLSDINEISLEMHPSFVAQQK